MLPLFFSDPVSQIANILSASAYTDYQYLVTLNSGDKRLSPRKRIKRLNQWYPQMISFKNKEHDYQVLELLTNVQSLFLRNSIRPEEAEHRYSSGSPIPQDIPIIELKQRCLSALSCFRMQTFSKSHKRKYTINVHPKNEYHKYTEGIKSLNSLFTLFPDFDLLKIFYGFHDLRCRGMMDFSEATTQEFNLYKNYSQYLQQGKHHATDLLKLPLDWQLSIVGGLDSYLQENLLTSIKRFEEYLRRHKDSVFDLSTGEQLANKP